ncbi:MFS transporter [Paenibacillus taiwanensis]|uniref:MFS transporter n=1 Tax=Paenibacillus taiwanensis TaxID=401638 RepID=UPI001FE21F3C|nr:MFS transporter [Paenibacillus taiwanensis]
MTIAHKAAFTSGNFAANLMAQMFSAYIVYYYVDILGVRPAHVGIVMVLHGLVGAVLNPLFGYTSDRIRTRWGRRVPYITFGMLPLAAVFTLLWIPLTSGPELIWYFLVIVLIYDVLYVLVILNYSALFPEMFVSVKERASASSWKQMFGILGMIAGVAVPPLIYVTYGWQSMGLLFGFISAVSLSLIVWGAHENKLAAVPAMGFWNAIRYTWSNRAFFIYVLGGFLVQLTFALLPAAIPFFTKYVLRESELANTVMLGTVFMTAIPFVYFWGRLTNRYGPRKVMLATIICYAASLSPLLWVTSSVAAYITSAGIGIGLAGIIVLLEVLLAEVIDDDEQRTGARREGMFFGMNGFIIRFGISLQAIIMSVILENSGYQAQAATQPGSALVGIRLMLAGIPIAALLLAFICFYLYPLRTGRTR